MVDYSHIDTHGYDGLPGLHALVGYSEHKTPVGDFLYGMLTNDLRKAFSYADANSQKHMCELFKFIYNRLPMDCWGSEKAYSDWMGNTYSKQTTLLSAAEYVTQVVQEAVHNLDSADRRMVLIDLAKQLGCYGEMNGKEPETTDDVEENETAV